MRRVVVLAEAVDDLEAARSFYDNLPSRACRGISYRASQTRLIPAFSPTPRAMPVSCGWSPPQSTIVCACTEFKIPGTFNG